MRRKLAPRPLARPSEIGAAARPLVAALPAGRLPSATVLQRALQASLAVSIALAAVAPIVGCREEVPEIHPERVVVIPRPTASDEGSTTSTPPVSTLGMGGLELVPGPKPYEEVVVTKPHPHPIKHVPPTPTNIAVPGGMKAPMIIPSPPPPPPGGVKPYTPIAPVGKPPKLGGEPMKTTPGSI